MAETLDCAACGINSCRTGGSNQSSNNCPMVIAEDVLEKASKLYENEYKQIAYAASLTAARGSMKWTRVEGTMEFAKLMKYKKLGIASCVGLARESAILERILRMNGFEVVSVICKMGAIPVEHLGIRDEEKAYPGQFAAMCNPLAQAALLDSAGSQLNILMGLCVGHDALFCKASKAPVTTLVAKDGLLGHNPVAAIYNHESYYKRLCPDNKQVKKSRESKTGMQPMRVVGSITKKASSN